MGTPVFREIYEDERVRLTSMSNMLVASWFDAPTMAQMRELRKATIQISRDNPTGGGFVNLILSGTPSFSREVLEEAAAQTKLDERTTIAVAHIIMVDGLIGSTVRTFLSTIMLVSRSVTPTKVFGQIEPAAAWLAPHFGATKRPWTADELAGYLSQVKEPKSNLGSHPGIGTE